MAPQASLRYKLLPRKRETVMEGIQLADVDPIAYSADESIDFSWGGCVEVTDTGGRQLVPREPGMVSLE